MPLFRRRGVRTEPGPAGPAVREDVARRLASAAPTTGPQLADVLLPAVRYATRREPDAAMDVGQTKFGGAPDLPQGTPWPTWTAADGERRPLQFFAQVDLAAAAAAAPGPLGLPTEGQLSFFADLGTADLGTEGGDASEPARSMLLFSPPRVQLVRCSPRIPPLPSGQLLPMGAWTWPAGLPGDGEVPVEEAASLDALERALDAELRATVPDLWLITGHHQLGGHGRFGPSVGSGSLLLLQLDSDDTLEVRWGAGGTIWWEAPQVDVAADRWERAALRLRT